MNRIYLIILILLAVLIFLYIFVKEKIAQLNYYILNFKFESFNLDRISGKFELLIKNNFLSNITISKLNLSIYIDGYFIGDLKQQNIQLTNIGDNAIMIHFSLSPKKIISINHLIASLTNYGNNYYTIRGSINIKKWFITAKIPIDFTSKFKEKNEVVS